MSATVEAKGLFFGLTTIDMIYLVDAPPGRNEKIKAIRQISCAGGPATNAAIAFSGLGGQATLISCLGKHPLAAIIHQELDIYSIDHIDLCPTKQSHPPLSSIIVSNDNGDRSVVSTAASINASLSLDVEMISRSNYKVALFDGQNMPWAIQLAQACRQAGIHTVLDGGSWKPGTEELILHIDTAICSPNFKPPNTTTLDDTFKWLHDHSVLKTAITRGELSILASEMGQLFEIQPPTNGSTRDTLAAGDIFHGAYAYYYSRSPDGAFSDHLSQSAAIASKACRYFGPRNWIDDLKIGRSKI